MTIINRQVIRRRQPLLLTGHAQLGVIFARVEKNNREFFILLAIFVYIFEVFWSGHPIHRHSSDFIFALWDEVARGIRSLRAS